MSGANRPAPRDYERLHSKLASILRICQKINSEQDLGMLLDLVTREAAQLLEAERASIFLFDERKEQLWSKVALGSDEVLHFDAHSGVAGAVVTTGQTINVADAYADKRFNPAIDARTGYRTKTILAVPLRKLDGEIIGVFEALNHASGVFSAEDEEVAKSLAAQVAIAIQTAQSVDALTRNHDELAKENAHLWREVEQRYAQRRLIGSSPRIQSILRLIDQIRDSSVTVLISGESGTGKELAARAIHYTSLRARRPLVALNCAALPETLLESELFGIERGVASGVQPRRGQFQAADGGTLFLDEIADLSLAAQAKILRVLQEQVFQRVGGRSEIRVDVRVIAASNSLRGWAYLTAQYRPALWDQLEWQGRHTAIISWVETPTAGQGGYTTWPVNIYECNADGKNTCHTYSSQFQIRTVNGAVTVTAPFTSTVSSYNKGPAPLFYRYDGLTPAQ